MAKQKLTPAQQEVLERMQEKRRKGIGVDADVGAAEDESYGHQATSSRSKRAKKPSQLAALQSELEETQAQLVEFRDQLSTMEAAWLLGYLRQQKIDNPSGTIDLFAARALYRRNDTESFVAAEASTPEMTRYAMQAAERRALLLATPVVTDLPRLNTLNMKQLTAQMRIHWQIFKDPVLSAIPNKAVLGRKPVMLSAVKEAVGRYIAQMADARRQLLDGSDLGGEGESDGDDGEEWAGVGDAGNM
uniref:Uncharacterized protein n=1 Tax=Mycena chlorophos TaxID=658473 RepID=A0ABQ0LU06_MYCCL|nr:predicted protein [Mycena chlorophos]